MARRRTGPKDGTVGSSKAMRTESPGFTVSPMRGRPSGRASASRTAASWSAAGSSRGPAAAPSPPPTSCARSGSWMSTVSLPKSSLASIMPHPLSWPRLGAHSSIWAAVAQGLDGLPQLRVGAAHLVHRGLVLEGRDVSDAGAGGDGGEDAAHDLAGAGLRQPGHEVDVLRRGDGPHYPANVGPDFLFELVGRIIALGEDGEHHDGLTLHRVADAGGGGLRDGGVGDSGVLQLQRAQAVTRHLEHLVRAAKHPEVAVLIADGVVAGVVEAGEARPVGLSVALRVVVDAHEHTGPGAPDRQHPLLAGRNLAAVVVHDEGIDSGQGESDRARLQGERLDAGSR